MSGFLYGWTLFLVIQTGTIAAVAVAFAKYSGVFVPWISAQNWLIAGPRFGLNTQQLVAIAVLVLLTLVEYARHPHRRRSAERLHLRQDRRAARAGGLRVVARAQPGGGDAQLRPLLG